MVDRVKFTCPGCEKPSYVSRNLCLGCRTGKAAKAEEKAEAQRLRGTVEQDCHADANIAAFERVCADARARFGVPRWSMDTHGGMAQAGAGEAE